MEGAPVAASPLLELWHRAPPPKKLKKAALFFEVEILDARSRQKLCFLDKIMLSPDARNTAWVSFDGRKRQEICHGDSISITTSCYPLPSICFRDPVSDWFESLAECLHWNVRKKQNNFAVEEEEF